MDLVNRATSSLFDVLLTPFELMGAELSLIVVSGLFGILALIVFKHISWQDGIRHVKDRIKGHMIAIRIYQDDLGIVLRSVLRVLGRNFQYLGLNFGPILPLFVPFALVAAQLVVRYGFDPLPVVPEERLERMLPGQGTMVHVEMKKGREREVQELSLVLPEGLVATSPLVRSPSDGLAFQEVVAIESLEGEIGLLIGGRSVGSKDVHAGQDRPRRLQPERVSGFWSAWLWPAEATFPDDSPVAAVRFEYPEHDLRWLPDGPLGVILVFFGASILFGLVVLKPLGIQI